ISEIRCGLHTKLFLFEENNNANLWLGSANATNAAYNNNIEFMVCLQGKKDEIGIDNFLGDKEDKHSFASLLMDYKHWESEQPDEIKIITKKLEEIRDLILELHLRLEVLKESEEDVYTLKIIANSCNDINIDKEKMSVFCWPITRKESAYKVKIDKLLTEREMLFQSLSLETLTSFLAFSIMIKTDKQEHELRFVLNLPIEGLPEGRKEKLLYSIISDRNKFIKYLIFLLSDNDSLADIINTLNLKRFSNNDEEYYSTIKIPLMEEMIRALSKDPQKLDAISRLVKKLKKSGKAAEILPEGFDLYWDPLMEVRMEENNYG
ncbi:MAG: hypothetical protein ACOCRO_11665, partial [Halanaerobiales bacterium]